MGVNVSVSVRTSLCMTIFLDEKYDLNEETSQNYTS